MEVKPGYKQTEVGVIPEEWEVRNLSDVSRKITDGDHVTPKRTSQGYYLLSARNVLNGQIDVSDVDYVGTAEYQRMKQRCGPESGDILISCSGTIGRVAVVPAGFECVLVRSAALAKIDHELADGVFLQFWLQGSKAQWQIASSVNQGAQPNLFLNHIERLVCPQPPLPEQRAIATALSDVDRLLGGLDRLIAKRRDLKQAAMQQLLAGQTRLPGFHGEWEVNRLGDVINLIRSGIYGEEKPRAGLRASSVATTSHIEMDDTWNNKEMPVRYFTAEKLRDYATEEGDLIVVKSSGSAASIQSGKLGLIDSERAGKFVFSNFLMLLRPIGVLPRFLYFYLCSHNVKKLLPTLVEASTYPNIRLGDYLDVEIPVPLPDEQTAIAEVLTEMDAELAALERRREKTRALKQAMMQELLTGRTRLI